MNMTKLSNPKILKLIIKLLILLVVAKSLSLAIWWLLPSDGVNLQVQSDYQPQYQRVDFKNMLSDKAKASNATRETTRNGASTNSVSVTNMLLNALYGSGSRGYAIVALKSSPKATSIVSVGESFSGYALKTILVHGVVFTKNQKEYVLNMNDDALKNNGKSSVTKVNADEDETEKSVSRDDINAYAKNPDSIWKDISITQLNNNQGFKITNIRIGSKMAALGLKKGDVMIRANNSELKSAKDAIDLYKNVNTLQTLQLVILRNNQEKEFVYEIN